MLEYIKIALILSITFNEILIITLLLTYFIILCGRGGPFGCGDGVFIMYDYSYKYNDIWIYYNNFNKYILFYIFF